MVLRAIKELATGRNGVSAFVLQCKRLDFHYCDWAGSSRGMNSFLKSPLLAAFSKAHPQIEIHISPRPHKHPVIRGHYVNGKQQAICVRNLAKEQVLQKAELLMEATGDQKRRIRGKNVQSTNESVRGIWSPHHTQLKGI